MEISEFTISIKNKQLIVECENTCKDMTCVYYINYDYEYEYIYNYIKKNGSIEISINDKIELIHITTRDNNYIFEYYMFDGDFDNDEMEEYELGYKCFEFYKYYFND